MSDVCYDKQRRNTGTPFLESVPAKEAEIMIYSQEAAAIPKEELRSRGEILEKRLQSSDLSEQDKQTELMNYLPANPPFLSSPAPELPAPADVPFSL